eukprot:scaffold14430_cov66-Cyclotella_meneghiniana.AAC.8
MDCVMPGTWTWNLEPLFYCFNAKPNSEAFFEVKTFTSPFLACKSRYNFNYTTTNPADRRDKAVFSEYKSCILSIQTEMEKLFLSCIVNSNSNQLLDYQLLGVMVMQHISSQGYTMYVQPKNLLHYTAKTNDNWHRWNPNQTGQSSWLECTEYSSTSTLLVAGDI